MKPALLLIDLQADFLCAAGLEPAAGRVVDSAERLLRGCRDRRIPVLHVWTSVQRQPDNRMPHWKAAGRWRCVVGEAGHQPPPGLRPADGEIVVHKQFFSGFTGAGGELENRLRSLGCDTLILAGVHLHGCVRATALDAYERGWVVWVADDAVASDDPLHAAITRRYLHDRCARFAPVGHLLQRLDDPAGEADRFTHVSPADSSRVLWQIPLDGRAAVAAATAAARNAATAWRAYEPGRRAQSLRAWSRRLAGEAESLADRIVQDIGKPIAMARAEIRRSVEILDSVAVLAGQPMESPSGPAARCRHEPLGVVAVVTPYNNPVAIPVGKIGPALLYGNTVVWKPAPAATLIARRVLELGRESGWPDGLVTICAGDHSTACLLAEDSGVDGLTLSGSARAGLALQELCARRRIPFQAELGGNNAAIVWDDAAMDAAAARIAEAAFGFAGQRCTANRRAIVAAGCFDAFLDALLRAAAGLAWGDPQDPDTIVGPLLSVDRRDEIQALLDRCAARPILSPHRGGENVSRLMARGAFFPPTIVVADDPDQEIVQEESFGPVLVVQRAADFDQAIRLVNGVRQGLAAALFSRSPARWEQFLAQAKAGVLKINRATADADATSPFGGWKASGVGPAEHGPFDREFDCRVQTIYDG